MGADNTFGETNFNPDMKTETKPDMEKKTAEDLFFKYCICINKNYGDYVIRDKAAFIKAIQQQLDALTAENDRLKTESYPKEFAEWIACHATPIANIPGVMWMVNSLEEDREFTTDELFNYWKENAQ